MENKELDGARQEVVRDSDEHVGNDAATQKSGVLNTLYPPGPRPGAGPRIKNHCRKFWWCDLLVLAVIILVIVLPIIYVAIPKKAQHDINASTLEVTSQEVTSPQPNQIHLTIEAIARSSSSFHPTLEAFQAGLSLDGQEPFLYLNVPEVKADAETKISIDQDAPIVNMDSFKEYTKTTIGSENFTVLMSGKTKVHQSGLSAISVDYNKRIEMKGLNKLSGLRIENIKILFGTKNELPDGSNMVGNAIIPNPSVMTLDLGNVTMDLSIDGKTIGQAVLPNLLLKPGDNNNTMTSKLDQLEVVQLITTKYKDGVVPFEIMGNSSVRNGEHLEYFEEAIKSNTIKLDLDVGPALAAIGLNITSSS
ncbi:hypothetical protein BU23DRAFT_459305 [Bimuria novae-zelandiae CBS 107.79]|uniref:Uncharacterized protein n=1 Tax=Bimuria novae-zelandiae CBS 107.79 TaxID=1447943 RepID=A0A6A5VCK2_9PLEO|nr:hypothetical protein BU23DRAFT_459305 [Bimuria novae-zelandiae CBS 107.79]